MLTTQTRALQRFYSEVIYDTISIYTFFFAQTEDESEEDDDDEDEDLEDEGDDMADPDFVAKEEEEDSQQPGPSGTKTTSGP